MLYTRRPDTPAPIIITLYGFWGGVMGVDLEDDDDNVVLFIIEDILTLF